MKPCAKRLGLLVVAAFVAGACAAATTPTIPPTNSAGPTAAPLPTPTPELTQPATGMPTASASGATNRVMFSGTLDCGFPDGLEQTEEGPITTYSGTIECTYEATDQRVSGTERGPLTMVELEMPGYHVNKWFLRGEDSPAVIVNAGGSWRATEVFGADQWGPTGGVHTVGTAAYVGEGGYAGLRMRLLYAQGTSEAVDAYVLMGWIEPAD